MNNKTHNGWTNYETWCVNLWLDNDEGTQSMLAEAVQDAMRESFDAGEREKDSILQCGVDAYIPLARELIQGDAMPDLGASVYSDLLGAALSEVNWYEMAQHAAENALDSFSPDETKELTDG